MTWPRVKGKSPNASNSSHFDEGIVLASLTTSCQSEFMTDNTDIAALGAALANPARAQILCVLMEGRAYTNKELASHAGITPQTATAHLQHLEVAGLTQSQRSGRCIYHVIATEKIAEFLESVGNLSAAQGPQTRAPEHLRYARSCYSHLAGSLGVSVAEALLADARIVCTGENWWLSDAGKDWVKGLGLTPLALKPCLDWSERRPHLAGPFANALLRWMFEHGVVSRHASGRGLIVQDHKKLVVAGLLIAA